MRRRAELVALAGVAVVVVISPWVIRNLTTFEEPFLPVVEQRRGAAGRQLPGDLQRPSRRLLLDHLRWGIPGLKLEESLGREGRPQARHGLHLEAHGRPAPGGDRPHRAGVGRVPPDPERPACPRSRAGRCRIVQPALYAYWVVLAFVDRSARVLLYRRRVTLIPLLAQVVMVTFIAATRLRSLRFRIPAEVALIVLAARRARRRALAPDPRSARAAAPWKSRHLEPVDEERMSRATHT